MHKALKQVYLFNFHMLSQTLKIEMKGESGKFSMKCLLFKFDSLTTDSYLSQISIVDKRVRLLQCLWTGFKEPDHAFLYLIVILLVFCNY